eukprot:6467731-Amphidinium_carterae.1
MCDTWWTGVTHILASEDGSSVIVKGLKPLRAEPNMVQLAKPVDIPPGWSDLAVQALASLWTVINIPNGSPLWVRLSDGTTHHSPPFVVETMSEGQLRLFLKDKDPPILLEDDEEIDVDAHRITFVEESVDKPSEESQSSSSEEPTEQNFDALHMQRS